MSDKNGGEFLFELSPRPEGVGDLAFTAMAGAELTGALVGTERTTCEHADGRPENVAEHAYMLTRVAYMLVPRFYSDPDGVQLDLDKVVRYCLVHDDVEAYVGDTYTFGITDEEYAEKERREERGLAQYKKDFGEIAPHMVADVEAYMKQEDPESQFVRALDKTMTVLIQLGCEAAALKKRFTVDEIARNFEANYHLFKERFPGNPEIFEISREIGEYVVRRIRAAEGLALATRNGHM